MFDQILLGSIITLFSLLAGASLWYGLNEEIDEIDEDGELADFGLAFVDGKVDLVDYLHDHWREEAQEAWHDVHGEYLTFTEWMTAQAAENRGDLD